MNPTRNSPLASYYSRFYDIRDYGASEILADNSGAIQAAITAATSEGGIVYIPTGEWYVANPLVGAPYVVLLGDGMGSVLQATSAFPAGQFMYSVNGVTSTYVRGVEIRNLHFFCNNVTGAQGVHIQGTYNAVMSNVKIDYFSGYALWLDGLSGTYGAYSTVECCQFLNGNADYSGNILTGVRTDRHEHSLIHNCSFAWITDTSQYAYGINSTGSANRMINNWFDMVDRPIYADYASGNIIQFNDIDRITGHWWGIATFGNYTDVSHNHFQTGGQTATYPGGILFNTNVVGGVCNGNNFEEGGNWTVSLQGGSSAAAQSVTVIGNNFGNYALGTTQNVILKGNFLSGMPTSMAPAVPATATVYTNPYPYGFDVYITGGTVTAVAINGVTTGQTAGKFYVMPLGTIELTYTAAPTWVWVSHP